MPLDHDKTVLSLSTHGNIIATGSADKTVNIMELEEESESKEQ